MADASVSVLCRHKIVPVYDHLCCFQASKGAAYWRRKRGRDTVIKLFLDLELHGDHCLFLVRTIAFRCMQYTKAWPPLLGKLALWMQFGKAAPGTHALRWVTALAPP